MTAEEAVEEVRQVRAIRRELMERGWLPPRNKDVLERTGKECGLAMSGFPHRWAIRRTYTLKEFPYSARVTFDTEHVPESPQDDV